MLTQYLDLYKQIKNEYGQGDQIVILIAKMIELYPENLDVFKVLVEQFFVCGEQQLEDITTLLQNYPNVNQIQIEFPFLKEMVDSRDIYSIHSVMDLIKTTDNKNFFKQVEQEFLDFLLLSDKSEDEIELLNEELIEFLMPFYNVSWLPKLIELVLLHPDLMDISLIRNAVFDTPNTSYAYQLYLKCEDFNHSIWSLINALIDKYHQDFEKELLDDIASCEDVKQLRFLLSFLTNMKSVKVIPWLKHFITESSSESLINYCLIALTQLEGDKSLPYLADIYKEYGYLGALSSIGSLRKPEYIELFEGILSNNPNQYQAISALGKYNLPETNNMLVELVLNPNCTSRAKYSILDFLANNALSTQNLEDLCSLLPNNEKHINNKVCQIFLNRWNEIPIYIIRLLFSLVNDDKLILPIFKKIQKNELHFFSETAIYVRDQMSSKKELDHWLLSQQIDLPKLFYIDLLKADYLTPDEINQVVEILLNWKGLELLPPSSQDFGYHLGDAGFLLNITLYPKESKKYLIDFCKNIYQNKTEPIQINFWIKYLKILFNYYPENAKQIIFEHLEGSSKVMGALPIIINMLELNTEDEARLIGLLDQKNDHTNYCIVQYFKTKDIQPSFEEAIVHTYLNDSYPLVEHFESLLSKNINKKKLVEYRALEVLTENAKANHKVL